MNWQNVYPGHRGAVEDEGPGREGHRHPSFQDADPQQRDSMGQRQHEGWVSSQNASICTGQIILCLRTIQELPNARQKARAGL